MWVSEETVLEIHAEQLGEHGGSEGLRDLGLFQSALARPQNQFAYGGPDQDIFDLAAAYGYGLGCNHAFIDGNKRTSLVVTATFLGVNGWEFDPAPDQAELMWLRLASGEVEQDELAEFIRQNVKLI